MPNPDNSNFSAEAAAFDEQIGRQPLSGDQQTSGRKGGADTHRNGCLCNACSSRRRKAEALARGAGPDSTLPALQQASLAALSDAHPKSAKLQKERIAKWLTWKAVEPKLTHAEAAERLGIAPQTLTNLIHEAAKAGWLQFVDPFAELEYKQIPMVNQVISDHLAAGDKDVAVKMAQATIWKQYAASKGIGDNQAPTTVLALKIEMPAGVEPGNLPSIKGVIVGQPRTIDAEVVEVKDE